jgi:hypothetical protein
MKACIIGWLSLAIILTALGQILTPLLAAGGEEDTAFAHEYAEEMLARLEQMSAEAGGTVDGYRADEEEFRSRKQAAVHLRGELAADFVYAFTWAEAWCHYAATGTQPADAARAGEALKRARVEFLAIRSKDYKKAGR